MSLKKKKDICDPIKHPEKSSTGILTEHFAICVYQTHGSENSVQPRHTLLSPHKRGNACKKHSLVPINFPGRLEKKYKALYYRPSATRNM
jgi:hypothetical protein